jgi:Cu/Ag efflux protein CusF
MLTQPVHQKIVFSIPDLMMFEKFYRIQQLKKWGYNTPMMMKIEYGTIFSDELYKKLKEFAGSAKKMTVRTYSPWDENREFKTDFYSEIRIKEAINKIKVLLPKYHVLFQEAIDVNTTLITGNIALKKQGNGFYDILKGPYRVRDVDNPPRGAKRISIQFSSLLDIQDIQMRKIVYEIKDIALLAPYDEGVIVEFNLNSEPIGEKKENLILWEYRKFE